MSKKLKLMSSMQTYKISRMTPKKKKNVLFIIGDWDRKVGSQEIPVVIGLKFGL